MHFKLISRYSSQICHNVTTKSVSTYPKSRYLTLQMNYKIEKLPHPKVTLGEGPFWDIPSQSLFTVNIYDGEVFRYDYRTNKVYSVNTGVGPVSLIVPLEGKKDTFIISSKCKLRLMTWDGMSKTVQSIEDFLDAEEPSSSTRINDGKCDPLGRLWAGTMGAIVGNENKFEDYKGMLFSVDNKRQLVVHRTQVGISNGLCWNETTNKFYFIDSLRRTVDSYDYYPVEGIISNFKTVFSFQKNYITGLPDGMTIDIDGNLWVAVFDGGVILKINPSEGKLLDKIKMPALQVTSVAFGGPYLDELFVTTAADKLDPKTASEYSHNGSTFKITGLCVQGLPMKNFVL